MSSLSSRAVLAVLLVASALPLSAQTGTLYVPDPNPQVPGGTSVNTIPFGSAAYTYVGRIPASLMDPVLTRVRDIQFAPNSSGIWSPTSALIGMGHVPAALPCPFTFPGPGGTTTGSFLDFTVLYDSSVHGPLNWAWTAGAFSPMGIPLVSGNTFDWNGIDDVAVYVTFQGSTTTSSCYRNPNGPPDRTYAASYQAAVSTACGAAFGLVMALDLGLAGNVLSVTDDGPGINNLRIQLTSISPTATEGWLLLTGNIGQPTGTGDFFGITPDATTFLFLTTSPLADGNPLHFPVPSTMNRFPNTPFNLPPGATAPLIGTSLDFVAVLVRPGLAYDSRSNVSRINF